MDVSWGEVLAQTEVHGRETDLSLYIEMPLTDHSYPDYEEASHVMLWARTDKKALGRYERRAIVLAQMRFDGYVGFPGGLVDPGESATTAVNRELEEEIAYDISSVGPVLETDLKFRHVHHSKKLILNFFVKELTEEQIIKVEIGSPLAKDHGDEALGLLHVPLYTLGDSYRGFPSFLNNNFIGNAKAQLIKGLELLELVSENYVKKSLNARPMTCS